MSGIGGQRGVLEAAHALLQAQRHFALAMVTDTEGSTYRKAGALALVADDGARVGSLSGGCLEPALDMLGRRAIDTGTPQCEIFDTRADDDLLFGSGSGCRGRMRVLAWPLPGPGDAVLEAASAAHATGRPRRLHVGVVDEVLGQVQEGDGPCTDGFLAVTLPATPRLLLLGAGPEAPPLLRLARGLGWWCAAADHREGLLAADRLNAADAVLAGRPVAALQALPQAADAVVVMTHLASADLEALQALADRPTVGYVGLLGPPARRDELLARLSAADRDALQPRLHAPVGLPLGGEGPEAIALAIAAALQRHFHGQT